MVQSSIQVENYVRRRLEFAIAKAVDLAAINGSGTASWTEPTATDDCGLISFSSTYSPGSAFAPGVTAVV